MREERPEWHPLTAGQMDFWEEFVVHPDQPVSTVAHCLKLQGPLDEEALIAALTQTVAEADTLALTVYRGALKPLSADIDTGKPEIPERFHERLMDWVLHRAYLKQDAETFDPAKAAQSLALFIQSFGERPDANVQRKRRDKRPPLVRSSW